MFNEKRVNVKLLCFISRMRYKVLCFCFLPEANAFSQPPSTRRELPYTSNTAMTESAILKIIIWIICKQMAGNTNTLSYNHHLSLWLPIFHRTCLCCCMLIIWIERTGNVSPYLLHWASRVPAGQAEGKRIALRLKHLLGALETCVPTRVLPRSSCVTLGK